MLQQSLIKESVKMKATENKKYRAVIKDAANGNERVESIWFDTEKEAIEAGKGGVPFYKGTRFIIETSENNSNFN